MGFYYDVETANYICDYFEEILHLAGGEFEGESFKLKGWQAFVVCSLFAWMNIETNYRRFGTAYVETGKGPLALDTPIRTIKGWSTMKDLSIGDSVFDEHGSPTKIIDVSPVFENRDCYKITFSDGAEIVADADHRWKVNALRTNTKPGHKKQNDDSPKKGVSGIVNTQHLFENFLVKKSESNHPQAKYNFSIDTCGPIDLEEKELPIPPYTLGAWLGDGDSDAARITCHDKDTEIIDLISREGVPVQKRSKQGNCARYVLSSGNTQAERDNSIQSKLRSLNLLNNKHIPDDYLSASIAQRRELLKGLLDTDGTSSGKEVEFTQCKKKLIEDFAELARSLGYKVRISSGPAKINGRVVGERWRVFFKAYSDEPAVFGLTRKQGGLGPSPKTKKLSGNRRIINVEKIDSVPVRCITIDSETHLFLAGREFIPTHNSGKSPLAAGIGIYMMTADNESRAEVYAVATKRDQAMILFRDAIAMYQQSPELSDRLRSTGAVGREWNLYYPDSGSFFRPISSENTGKGQSGPRPHCNLFDEIHEHASNAMIEFMSAGKKSRRQPLDFMITNSGHDRQSVCYEYHDYGKKVAAGEIDDNNFFSYICELDEEDEPFTDETCWIKVNPSLPQIPTYDYLRKQVKAAKGMPSKESIVRRLNFCEWVGAETPAFSKDAWLQCLKNTNMADFDGLKCVAAIDLSSKLDLTSLTILFHIDGIDYTFNFYWTPKDTLKEREDRDRVPYQAWVDHGNLIAIQGSSIQYSFIAFMLMEINEITPIEILAFDRWRIDDLLRELDELDVQCHMTKVEIDKKTGKEMIIPVDKYNDRGIALLPHGQGFKDMSPAVDDFEEDLQESKIVIQNNPVTTMCASNSVLVEDPAGNRKFSKQKATGRIDGIISIVMANRAARFLPDIGDNYYNSDGLMVVG